MDTVIIYTAAIAIFIFFIVGILIGAFFMRLRVDKENKKLYKTTEHIIEKSRKEANDIIKDAKLEGKDIVFQAKKDAEQGILIKKQMLVELDKKAAQKEEQLDKKTAAIIVEEEVLAQKEKNIDKLKESVEKEKHEYLIKKETLISQIESVASMTSDEARKILMDQLVDDAKLSSIRIIKEIEEEARQEGERKAQNIIATSVQRISSDFASNNLVSVVNIVNEEMKGRIIGKEGRNIRTFESITGVNIIVDDVPETVTLSCFDPFRREIAKLTLEKLITDGRIHPARIEELFQKSKIELEKHILEVGNDVVFNLGLQKIHPDLVKLIGRLKYRTSYGQSALQHSLEVAKIAGMMASELGIEDIKMVKRCGILHDIGKAIDMEIEGSHTQIGVDLAKKYKEDWRVSNSILAHHFEEPHKCIEAILVHAADALSAGRPGARREVVETYIKRMEKLEEIINEFEGVQKSYAVKAGQEVRIIVEPSKISDDKMSLLSRDISSAIEKELTYPGQIKVTVIRESRAIEYAK